LLGLFFGSIRIYEEDKSLLGVSRAAFYFCLEGAGTVVRKQALNQEVLERVLTELSLRLRHPNANKAVVCRENGKVERLLGF
jgi:hypothetical protein